MPERQQMPFFILAYKHSTVVYQRTLVVVVTAQPNRNIASVRKDLAFIISLLSLGQPG